MSVDRRRRICARASGAGVLFVAMLALGAMLPAPGAAAGSATPAPRPRAAAMDADAALLQARDAAAAGDAERLAALAPVLAGQLLEAYIPYWQATLQLHATVPDEGPARSFLARYPGTMLADRLRADWLLFLGAKGDFAQFEAERRHLVMSGDDVQLGCYTLLSRYARDGGTRRDAIAREARRVLALAPDPGGEGCSALADRLLDDGALSVWPRLQALVERDQLTPAQKTAARLLPDAAPELRRLLTKPSAWLAAHGDGVAQADATDRDLAVLAMLELGRDAPEEAAEFAQAWEPALGPEDRALVWGRIGRSAQLKLLPQAHGWFARGGLLVGVGLDYPRATEVLESRARAALRRGSYAAESGTGPSAAGPDWEDLHRTIGQMPPELQADPAWIYWDAQALRALGREPEALAALQSIAGRFGYYGRLAAEQLREPFALPPRPEPPDAARVDEFEQRPGFQRARKLFALGMRDEAMREWNWELRGMDDAGLHAVAELGRRMGLLDRMIASSERTRAIVDLEQRFPLPYPDLMTATSVPLGMDPAWIYGLIRQESRFIEDVHSAAGAIGLMQLMPSTARYVAHRIGFEHYRTDRIAEVGVNLRLGTEYLKMVLDDQDGLALLASAAYNAGPNRVRKWRAALARPLDGAIFVETIPINETRDYVKRVLFNTTVYGSLLQRAAGSLQAMLAPVGPGLSPPTGLP
jgi:soluble lytic murein transglycosylase